MADIRRVMESLETSHYIDTWCTRLRTATERKDLHTISEMIDSLQSPDDQQYPLRSMLTRQPMQAYKIVNTLKEVGGVDSQTIAQFLFQADCPIAVLHKFGDIVEHMIRLGSSVNYVPEGMLSTLHGTIMCGPADARSRLRLIEVLLNNGADCHYIDLVGMSPLQRCMYNPDSLEVLRLLVARGVRSNSPALITAINTNQPSEVIQLLMQVHTDARFRDDRGFADLYSSTYTSNKHNLGEQKIDYLLNDLGMDPKTLGLEGGSILYFAFSRVSLEYLRYLVLVCGIDLNIRLTAGYPRGFIGQTVSRLSETIKTQEGYEDVAKKIRLFLLRGADINGGSVERSYTNHLSSVQKDKWVNLRLEQTAINEFMDLPVDKLISNVFYTHRIYVSYIAACKYELVALMDTQFYNHVTLFNILTDSDDKMMNCVGNEELLTAFRKYGEKHLFPIYWPALTERVEQFLYLHRIRQKAMEVFCPLLPSVITYEVKQEIAKHLSIMDLFKLSKFTESG